MRSRLLAPVLTLVAGVGLALPGQPATAAPTHAPLPTHVNDCWSTDKVPPVVDSFEATPTTVDADSGPTAVQLTVAAHDLGGPGPASGVGRVVAYLSPGAPASGPQRGPGLNTRLFQSSDGLWHGSVTVPAGTNASYDVTVVARDKSDRGTLSPQGGFDSGSGRFAAFDVTSTTGPPSDTTAPTLTGLTLSTEHVNTHKHAGSITVTATATDDDAGVHDVTVGLNATGRNTDQIRDRSVTLERVPSTDQWRGQLHFGRWAGTHPVVLSALITDNSGNGRRMLHGQLSAHGFPSVIQVDSGPLDTVGPRIVHVTTGARTVDVRRHGRRYAVRVVLADPQGVATADATLSRIGVKHVQLRRVSGSAARGTWVGRLRVPRCVESPATVQLRIRATDRHGVFGGGFPRSVRIRSTDHVPPSTKHIFWRIHEPVFRFTEPVHGISATTVEVYDAAASNSPQLLTGSWSCRGAKKQAVGCRKGPALEAKFTPDEPGVIPDAVVWEPGLQLNVLDAHGNPFVGGSESPDVSD